MANKEEREIERWITVRGARVPIFKGESTDTAIKRAISKMKTGKAEKAAREMTGNETGKLRKSEKNYIQMEEEKRRRKEGIETKYRSGDHSKLSQHSEIQKMADEHIKKIWTQKGGVKLGELYDEADKFAEKNNFDKNKVRDAAFQVMAQKHVESVKLKDEGKDPLQGVKDREKARQNNINKTISDNDDLKEKQIAQNKAQRDKLNGKEEKKKEEVVDQKLKNAPYADEEHKPEYLKKVKKGDFIKLNNKPNGTVYVRGDYDKGLKAFECYKYDDVNSIRWIKANKIVYIGFTF